MDLGISLGHYVSQVERLRLFNRPSFSFETRKAANESHVGLFGRSIASSSLSAARHASRSLEFH
jgi:hypothetical protein